jgi:hypothetical protein
MSSKLHRRALSPVIGSILFCSATPSLATTDQQRAVGSQYYYCQLQHNFLLAGPTGGMPKVRDITKSDSKEMAWITGDKGPEVIEANAIVEMDGRISDLNMSWMQYGMLGWPYVARTDLDNILLYIGYGGEYPLAEDHKLAPQGNFDPDKLFVEIETRDLKPIRIAREIALSRPGEMQSDLRSLAEIPPWQKSASISMWLRDLDAFRGKHDLLEFRVNDLLVEKEMGLKRRYVRGGTLHLGILPEVISQFSAAEQKMRVLVRRRETDNGCRLNTVQPEPVNDEEML